MADPINIKELTGSGSGSLTLEQLIAAITGVEVEPEQKEDWYWCNRCDAWHVRDEGGKKTRVEETTTLVDQLIDVITKHGLPTKESDVTALRHSIAGINMSVTHDAKSGKVSEEDAEAMRDQVKRLVEFFTGQGFEHTDEDEIRARRELANDYIAGTIAGILQMEAVFYTKKVGVDDAKEAIDIVDSNRDIASTPYGAVETDDDIARMIVALNEACDRVKAHARRVIDRE